MLLLLLRLLPQKSIPEFQGLRPVTDVVKLASQGRPFRFQCNLFRLLGLFPIPSTPPTRGRERSRIIFSGSVSLCQGYHDDVAVPAASAAKAATQGVA